MAAAATQKSYNIPKTYKAAVYDQPGKISTKVVELDTPEPGPGEVLVHLTHSGVCHSDMGVMQNAWPSLPYPTQAGQVGGHEGVGIVEKLGPGVEGGHVKLGDRVGIKWVAGTCGACPPCLEGVDASCLNQKISGYYYPGTFQQYAIGPANYVTAIPEGLDSAAAAPMLCAGVTVYSALRKSTALAGQWVVISGSGGGLGHLATQIASRGMAMRVLGVDHGSKESLTMECGAEAFLDITKYDDKSIAEKVKEITGGGAQSVIVCTAANRAYTQGFSFLKFNGTLVCIGVPEGDMVPISNAYPASFIFQSLKVVGSAVGNLREAKEVLNMAARGVVKTHFHTEKLENLTSVFQDMAEQKLTGRVVLDLQ